MKQTGLQTHGLQTFNSIIVVTYIWFNNPVKNPYILSILLLLLLGIDDEIDELRIKANFQFYYCCYVKKGLEYHINKLTSFQFYYCCYDTSHEDEGKHKKPLSILLLLLLKPFREWFKGMIGLSILLLLLQWNRRLKASIPDISFQFYYCCYICQLHKALRRGYRLSILLLLLHLSKFFCFLCFLFSQLLFNYCCSIVSGEPCSIVPLQQK